MSVVLGRVAEGFLDYCGADRIGFNAEATPETGDSLMRGSSCIQV